MCAAGNRPTSAGLDLIFPPLPLAGIPVRLDPLGLDRRYNRYWQFTFGSAVDSTAAPHSIATSLRDPEEGRVYIESEDNGSLRRVQACDAPSVPLCP